MMKAQFRSPRIIRSFFAWLEIPTLTLASVFLAGCSSMSVNILHMHADPAFTRQQLEEGPVAILPALSSTPMMDATELPPVRGQLASLLAMKRPGIGLVDQARVDSGLVERPLLAPVLQRFAHTLAISPADLRELGVATGARYIVFVVFDEYSFGWGDRPPPQYITSSDTSLLGAAVGAGVGGLIGLGLSVAISEAGSGQKTTLVQPATVTGSSETRLAGTVSIFNAVEGRAVWVGAAMVNESLHEEGQPRAADALQTSMPVPTPAEPSKLTPGFLKALVDRWPS